MRVVEIDFGDATSGQEGIEPGLLTELERLCSRVAGTDEFSDKSLLPLLNGILVVLGRGQFLSWWMRPQAVSEKRF